MTVGAVAVGSDGNVSVGAVAVGRSDTALDGAVAVMDGSSRITVGAVAVGSEGSADKADMVLFCMQAPRPFGACSTASS